MPNKILIVTEYFYPEEFKINEVALEWKNKGYRVDILTHNPTYPYGKIYENYQNKWFSKETYEGMTVYRIRSIINYKTNLFKKLLNYFTFMMLGSLTSLLIGKKYDYVFGFAGGALTGMVPAVILKQFYKKPVTLWVQDIWPDSVYAFGFKKTKILSLILNMFVRYVYKYSSNFAITSKGFKKKILAYANDSKEILYAPNWADYLNRELDKFYFSNDYEKIHFTFAGNIGSLQNMDNVIEAFASLDDEHSNKAQLNIIGDGSNFEKIENTIKENKYNNIILWGRKPRSEIYKYLEASDFLVVSLIDKEIFSYTVPAKIQTYIAIGKPIIAIINGETANIIKKYELGMACAPDNIKKIKSTFKVAIKTSRVENNKYMKNSTFLTNTLFKKEIIIDNLLELLKRG